MTQPALVLVHGAWHGSWCWDAVLPHLDGIEVVTVDLPSVSDQPSGFGDMAADADAVRAAIAGVDGPVVVCAHSYGGIPATEAAADAPNVARLVYLCAFQVDVGDSLASVLNFEVPDWQRTIPSTYVVCERDQAIPVAAQDAMSQRATRVLRLQTSHSPFLARPRELADLLRGELANG